MKIMKVITACLGKIIIKSVYEIMTRLCHDHAFRFSMWVSSILLLFFRERRQKNLRFLFPGLSKTERGEIEQRHIEFDALFRVHLAHIQSYDLDSIDVEGEDLLKIASEEGKGVIIVGGHCGSWWSCPWALALKGYKVNVVVNPKLFPPLLDSLLFLADYYGIEVIYAGQDAHDKVQHAMEYGEIVYLNVDVSLRPKRNVGMPLLGAILPMDPGPALLALVQDAPIFWVSCYHHGEQRMGLSLRPEPGCGHNSELDTCDAVLQHWAGKLEQDLMKNPEQWWPLSIIELQEGTNTRQSSIS